MDADRVQLEEPALSKFVLLAFGLCLCLVGFIAAQDRPPKKPWLGETRQKARGLSIYGVRPGDSFNDISKRLTADWRRKINKAGGEVLIQDGAGHHLLLTLKDGHIIRTVECTPCDSDVSIELNGVAVLDSGDSSVAKKKLSSKIGHPNFIDPDTYSFRDNGLVLTVCASKDFPSIISITLSNEK